MKARRHPLRALARRVRRTRRVLVAVSSPMNVVVLRPILDVLVADDRVELAFTGRHHDRDDVTGILAATGLGGAQVLSEAGAKRLAADLYLCADGTRYGKRCSSRVLTFHGVSFKGRSLGDRAGWFHRVMLVGPYQRRRLVERGTFAADDPVLVDVGMPKLDRLARGEIDRFAERERLDVAPHAVCILYAPTWGPHASLNTMGEPLIDALAAYPKAHVVVKLHDHTYDPSHGGGDWSTRVERLRRPNVTIHRGLDVAPLLAAADVLVTDASSVAQEFCLLDRPILFADVPGLFASERYRDSADMETWGRSGGVTFSSPGEVDDALRATLAAPDALSDIRRAIATDLFFAPGRATERALEVIYAELEIPLRRRD